MEEKSKRKGHTIVSQYLLRHDHMTAAIVMSELVMLNDCAAVILPSCPHPGETDNARHIPNPIPRLSSVIYHVDVNARTVLS